MNRHEIHVQSASTSRVISGRGSTDDLSGLLGEIGPFDSLAVLYDTEIEHRALSIADSLSAQVAIAVAGGESAKTLERVGSIARRLLDARVSRRSALINIGGGVVTDLGGFVASIYLRGITFVHVPTTLVGMSDAAVGGKTGVDVAGVKNILGTFAQPAAVVIDPRWLDSLGDEELRGGLVEVVKKGAMFDEAFFCWLEADVRRVLERDPDAVDRAVDEAVMLKAKVVADDERESGTRMFLNYGHTIGHALETLSGFGLSHGRAVSIGMVAESAMVGDDEVARRMSMLLERLGMPTVPPTPVDRGSLWRVMTRDKKVAGGEVRIAVPSRIGEGCIVKIERSHLDEVGW